MTPDELRRYNRIKQRESRERRGVGKKRRPPIAETVEAFVPFDPRVINGSCSVRLDLDELSHMPETHIHAILEGVGKVIAASGSERVGAVR